MRRARFGAVRGAGPLVALAAILALAGLLVPASGAAQGTPRFSEAQALDALREAREALDPPAPLSASAAAHSTHATLALRDLAIAMPALEGRHRVAARQLLTRPKIDDGRRRFKREADGSPLCSPEFCIHWSSTRADAPSSDAFIDQIFMAMERSYAIENGALGWREAKDDGGRGSRGGEGGDGQVDVYVTNLGRSLYGYAAPDPGQRGSKRHAYLVLDNDYVGFPSPPIPSMQVTVAHEYNHILQFGYDVFQDLWLFESTAVWIEEQVYPELDDYLNYLPAFANQSRVPMTRAGIKIYGEAVFSHWLAHRYGPDLLRGAWEQSQANRHFAVDSYDAALRRVGTGDMGREFAAFAAESAEWRSSNAFPDAGEYPMMRRSGKLGESVRGMRSTLDNTAYELLDVAVRGGGPVKLAAKAELGTQSAIALVGRIGASRGGTVTTRLRYMPNGGRASVTLGDPGRFSRITAVIVNADGRSRRRDTRGDRVYSADGARFRIRLGG